MRLFIAGSNAPTPGSIIALQSLESLKFLINIISSPRLSKRFSYGMDVTHPIVYKSNFMQRSFL